MATDAFTVLAERSAAAFGLPDVRMVIVPHPVNTLGAAEVAALAKRAVAALVPKLVAAP
ncbi:MAG: hypothetical protein HY691_14245 [Chloroflexi bacterium]|nr:hypothetical protein [Chloroflexota bacterium]